MSRRLTIISSSGATGQRVVIIREGAVAAGPLNLTAVGAAAPRAYYVDVPANLGVAAHYQHLSYRTDGTAAENAVVRASGEFYWTGTDVEATGAARAQVEILVAQSRDALQNAIGTVIAAIAGLENVSVTEIEAALLDDGDATAFKAGLAATIEAALANEADGNATIAVFEGAVAAALAAYNAARVADVNQAATDVIAVLPTPSDATLAKQDEILAAVGAQNDLSATQVRTEVEGALITYDGATSDELASGVASLSAQSLANKGLTVAQEAILERLRDIAEADEVYTPTKAQKLLKGTSTVLVDKDVTSTTTCDVDTSLIEAP